MIDSLIANVPPKGQAAIDLEGASVERRARAPSEALEWRYVQNGNQGRTLQFLFVAGLGFILAACAYDAGIETLSRPLSMVSTQLAHAQ